MGYLRHIKQVQFSGYGRRIGKRDRAGFEASQGWYAGISKVCRKVGEGRALCHAVKTRKSCSEKTRKLRALTHKLAVIDSKEDPCLKKKEKLFVTFTFMM